MPGGGQVGLSAPPPPPLPDPEPIVVSVGSASIEVTAAGAPVQVAADVDLDAMRDHAGVRFERMVDAANRPSPRAASTSLPAALRLLVMRHAIERAMSLLSIRIGLGS